MTKNNYDYARLPSIINKKMTSELFKKDHYKKHHPYSFITYSPQSNKLLLELAQDCLQQALKEKPNKILLWISLTSLDKVGHIYGPDSIEYVDTIYHIDHYLKDFMNVISNTIPHSKITYALTADHGSTPIVELEQKKGFNLAQRLLTNTLQKDLNNFVEKKYGIQKCVQKIYAPSVFLNHSSIATLDQSSQKALQHDIKQFIKKQPGVKNVWTYQELNKLSVTKDDTITYFKNQLFDGRMGSILYQTYPYVYSTESLRGTGHISCYDYTTHVPLIFYQPTRTSKKIISEPVSMTQCAPTLAQILSIPTPAACLDKPLPQ